MKFNSKDCTHKHTHDIGDDNDDDDDDGKMKEKRYHHLKCRKDFYSAMLVLVLKGWSYMSTRFRCKTTQDMQTDTV